MEWTVETPVQTPTEVIRYHSAGHCVVLADLDAALDLCRSLPVARWTLCWVVPGQAPEKLLGDDGECVLRADAVELLGHLGSYTLALSGGGQSRDGAEMAGETRGAFDTVLDVRAAPALMHPTLPFGYFAPRTQAERDAAVAALSALEGDFEKPRYFRYDASVCAHGASRQIGCTRCLDACDTGAIVSVMDAIEIDPYLCQGCGQCATVCPTGAVRYAWPAPAVSAAELRTALLAREDRPTVVVYPRESTEQVATAMGHRLAELSAACLPVAVEEVASIGPDIWWSALAWGASRVVLVIDLEAGNGGQAVAREIETAAAMLEALGVSEQAIAAVETDTLLDCVSTGVSPPTWHRGRFGATDDKRTLIRLAVEHLHASLACAVDAVGLPPHASFGRVEASDACTLCMSCVSVCPANALLDGSGVPALRFIEQQCVQCGLCESACPENAISREQRFVFDGSAARETRELRAEEPFLCVECAKPFAVKSVIEKMQSKLAGHWMFQDDAARRRLLMCEDCRVKDQF